MKHLIAILFFVCGLASAQVNPPTIWRSSRTTPSGNCAAGTGVETIPGGVLYTCQNGTWVQVSGGGGSSLAPFTTDGTNVTLPSGTLSVGNTLPAGTLSGIGAANLVGVTPEQFGAVGDGVTDDVSAFFAMARALRLAGGGTVTFNPGKTYVYSNNRWSRSVPNLRIIGNGANLKCINAGGSYDQDAEIFIGNAAMVFDLDNETTGQSDHMHQADYIATVASGSSTITLNDNTQTVNYPAGMPVFISGYSQQTPTFPPNPRYFEWGVVLSSNPSTGVITLTKPIVNNYRSDWISDYALTPITYGPAAVMPLSRPKFVMGQNLYIEDVTFLENPNAPSYERGNEGLGYVQIAGYMNAILNRVKTGYIALGDCQNAKIENSYAVKIELDKETSTFSMAGSKVSSSISQGTGIGSVDIENSSIDAFFSIAPRHLKVANTAIGCNAGCVSALGAMAGGPGGNTLSTPTLSSVYDNVTFVQPTGSTLPLVNNGPVQTVTVATTDNSTYITVTGQTTPSVLEFMEGRPITGSLGGSGVITAISWSGSTVTFTGTFTAQAGEVFTVRPCGTLTISSPTTTGKPSLVYAANRQDNLSSIASGATAFTAVSPTLRYLGDGSDGAIDCNGVLNGIKYATTFNVSAGHTCVGNSGNSPLIIFATGACTVAGTISARGVDDTAAAFGTYGGAGGGGGGGTAAGTAGVSTLTSNGILQIAAGGTAGTSSGGTAGNGAAFSSSGFQRAALQSALGVTLGGSKGGAGGSSGGGGGNPGQAVILDCASVVNTGIIDVSGAPGNPATANTQGGGGGAGAGFVWLIARDSVVNTGTVYAQGGPPGQCYATNIVFSTPATAISSGAISSGTGALAHVSTYAGGNPTVATVDAAGSGYNYTPNCAIVGVGTGATCTAVMAGSSPSMTLSSVTIAGGAGNYGTGTTYTTCGAGGYGGNGWMKALVMQ